MPQTPRLEVGNKAPAFSLPDADGNTVSLADYKGRKVIVYFYPAASTPGCTKEACDFRDNLSELNDAGLDVVGISPDKPTKLAKFSDEDDVRQDRSGRHSLDVRRRREGQDRGGTVQHSRHRARRQITARSVRLNRGWPAAAPPPSRHVPVRPGAGSR